MHLVSQLTCLAAKEILNELEGLLGDVTNVQVCNKERNCLLSNLWFLIDKHTSNKKVNNVFEETPNIYTCFLSLDLLADSRFPFYLSISLSLMLSRAGALGGVVIRWLKLLIHYLFFQSWEKRRGRRRRRIQKQSHLCVCILEGRAIKLRFFCFPSFFMHSLSLSLSFFFLICVFWLNS